jgi:hypothetical protein
MQYARIIEDKFVSILLFGILKADVISDGEKVPTDFATAIYHKMEQQADTIAIARIFRFSA